MLPAELARPSPIQPEMREAPPAPEERAGARVHNATQGDAPSDRRKYRGAFVRKSDSVADALNNVSTIVEARCRRHAAHWATRSCAASRLCACGRSAGAALPDLVTGVATGLVAIVEVVRAVRRGRVKRTREHDGNG